MIQTSMPLGNSVIEVTDKAGWRREYPLEKNLLYIGSDAQNDIILDTNRGTGVLPRHLQLLAHPETSTGYRIINLSNSPLALGNRTLPPRASADIKTGEPITVGEFTLTFYGSVGATKDSSAIGLRLNLPSTDLHPDYPLEGTVTVRNLGEEMGVQFTLELDGFPDNAYELEPGPLLFPKAAKDVRLQLFHPEVALLSAGEEHITIQATAPDAYPGQTASASQIIQVLPVYRHTVRVVNPKSHSRGQV